jgi:hypothetical protein
LSHIKDNKLNEVKKISFHFLKKISLNNRPWLLGFFLIEGQLGVSIVHENLKLKFSLEIFKISGKFSPKVLKQPESLKIL